jgi:eukaryotic-like serine/threonine-protein kinase
VDRLADDLERYLLHKPVLARPDSWTYRAGKFARRHRGSVGGAVATLASVVGFGVVSLVLAAQVEAERNEALAARGEAQAVTDFLVEVFDATDPNRAQGLDLTAREILGTGGIRMRTELGDQPAVQGAVAMAIGEAYRLLGAPDSAATTSHSPPSARRRRTASGACRERWPWRRWGASRTAAASSRKPTARWPKRCPSPWTSPVPMPWRPPPCGTASGNVRHARSELEAAEAAYLEALRIREAVLGPDAP